MTERGLFLGNLVEEKPRLPLRPLGAVSDFVVETLPDLIKAIDASRLDPQELAAQTQRVVETLDERAVASLLALADGTPHPTLDQAAFDLKMLEIALVTYALAVPPRLAQLVERFATATDQPAMITYEELIYINPESDPRTFTQGAVGASEYDFYFGHLRIERALARVIEQVKQAAVHLMHDEPQVSQAVTALDQAVTLFTSAQADMTAIGMDLPKEHFAIFRKFFTTHPTRKLKGPSGNFTPAIPVLDMLLGGENLEQSHLAYLQANEMYFPRAGRREMAQAAEKVSSGLTLTALATKFGSPPELMTRLQALSHQIRQFRGQHYKGVKHQIPEAIGGRMAGTGGESDPGQFLRERMRIRHTGGDQDGH